MKEQEDELYVAQVDKARQGFPQVLAHICSKGRQGGMGDVHEMPAYWNERERVSKYIYLAWKVLCRDGKIVCSRNVKQVR